MCVCVCSCLRLNVRPHSEAARLFFPLYTPSFSIVISKRTKNRVIIFSCIISPTLLYSDELVNLLFAFVMLQWQCHRCENVRCKGAGGQRMEGWVWMQAYDEMFLYVLVGLLRFSILIILLCSYTVFTL